MKQCQTEKSLKDKASIGSYKPLPDMRPSFYKGITAVKPFVHLY